MSVTGTATTGRLADERILAEYRDKGYAVLRGLFTRPQIAGFQREADRIGRIEGVFGDPSRGGVRNSEQRSDRIDPVIDVSPLFFDLATSPLLIGLAGELLGGPAQLLKDKYIVKGPGAGGYGVHQDLAYWQELGTRGDRTMTIALCIDACTVENGAVEFAPGFHDRLLTPSGVVADPDESQFPHFEPLAVDAGDLLLFSSLAPHRSRPNRSDTQRRILFLTYVRDERPGLYEFYQHARKAF